MRRRRGRPSLHLRAEPVVMGGPDSAEATSRLALSPGIASNKGRFCQPKVLIVRSLKLSLMSKTTNVERDCFDPR